MKPLEKLYSDLLKADKGFEKQGAKRGLSCSELFVSSISAYDKNLKSLALDLAYYIENLDVDVLKAEAQGEPTLPQSKVDLFYNIACFLMDKLEKDQNLSTSQWQNLYASVTASQDELPIELLQNYLSHFLERGIF